jgi:hypothetical protein
MVNSGWRNGRAKQVRVCSLGDGLKLLYRPFSCCLRKRGRALEYGTSLIGGMLRRMSSFLFILTQDIVRALTKASSLSSHDAAPSNQQDLPSPRASAAPYIDQSRIQDLSHDVSWFILGVEVYVESEAPSDHR